MDFKNAKKQVLLGKDLSKKGSVDDAILSLVNYINSFDNYVTTSSCSGRVILLTVDNDVPAKKAKNNCNWLFTSHSPIEAEDLITHADPSNGDLLFKFEPFILHVMCADTNSASELLKIAIGAGYRESGMTIGSHGKVMVAIRGNIRLEVPISEDSVMLVSDAYFMCLARKANDKFEANFRKIKIFQKVLEEILESRKKENEIDTGNKISSEIVS